MSKIGLVTLLTLSLVGGVLLDGQTTSQQGPLGVISGRLVDAERGGPIRQAQVRLVSTAPRMTRATTSDDDGRFAFQGLPATTYTLTASRSGFLDMVYGARRPRASSQGSPILLSAGQRIENISLALSRAGVIAGSVMDESGDPAFNVQVRAMRLSFANGELIPQAGGTAVTDDLGAYRIAGLPPGEYLVAAVPRDTVMTAQSRFQELNARAALVARGGFEDSQAVADRMRQAEAEGRAPQAPNRTGHVPVYYPGTASPSEALRVELGIGQQMLGIDMRLMVVSTATLTGTVTSPDGQPGAAHVQLINPAAPSSQVGSWSSDAGPSGRFSFAGLVPGSYVLGAQRDVPGAAASAGGPLTGSADVQLAAGETGTVTVSLQPGVQVAGSLEFGAIPAPFDRARVRVTLAPLTAAAEGELAPRTATPDAGGRFVLRGVTPARYRLEVTGLPTGWHLASAVFNGRDAADHHLLVTRDNRYDGVFTFTSTTSELSGRLARALGAPPTSQMVVLFPVDAELRVPASRRIRMVQSSTVGQYTITGLPPGDYCVAAVEDIEPGQQFDRPFLEALQARSVTVTLAKGDKKSLDVPVR